MPEMIKMISQISLSILSPCKDCTDRQLHCHSTCDRYKVYKAEIEQRRAAKKAEADEINFAAQVKQEVQKRYYKDKKKRRRGI